MGAFITEFFVPGLFPGMNEIISANRKSVFEGNRQKHAEQIRVIAAIRQARLRPVKNYPVIIEMRWAEKNYKRDPDNIAAAKKYILDALQIAGIIKNDGRNEIISFSDTFITDKRNPGVLVQIYEKR